MKNSSSGQYNISSLVKPEWDNSSKKSSWANRILDPNDSRLFRLELKGSYLLVHKPPAELSFAKSMNVKVSQQSSGSGMGMILDNEFVKSKTDVISSSQPIHKTESNVETEDAPLDGQVKAEAENEVPVTMNPLVQSDSMLLSMAIDEYESAPGLGDAKKLYDSSRNTNTELNDLVLDADREAFDNYNKLLGARSVEMSQRPSMKPSSQGSKHLPLIIHDLYYQSPSCPHPKLVFDMTSGLILRGTLEAMCHTILFYPSDRMAEKLVEILPLVSSLSEPLVYFLKYLEHFTDAEVLKKKSIIMTDMETGILLNRVKRIIEITLEKFNGTLLDDEIFNLLGNLVNLLSRKSGKYLRESDVKQISEKLIAHRASLLRLISFEKVSTSGNILAPIEILQVSQTDLISGEKFIMLSTESLAHEIHAIDAHFMKYWSPRSDRSTIFSRLETIEASFEYWRFNPLQFIPPIHTHYLGRLLAFHLFEDKSTSVSPEKRSHVLMKWIHLGSTLCEQGDMVSWLGIAIMVCSQPVLRLSETWGHVERSYLQTIKKKWAPVVFEVRKNELFGSKDPLDKQNHSQTHGSELPVSDSLKNETNSNIRIMITNRVGELYAKEDAIPHFGELFTADTADFRNEQLPSFETHASNGNSEPFDLFKTDFIKNYCSYLEVVGWNLKQWDNYYDTITNKPGVKSKFLGKSESSNDPSIIDGCKDKSLSNILKTAITYNASEGPFSLNYFMGLSVQAEPPYVGQFARFHGTSRSPLFLGSYASILFPEVLPYYGIYDRRELIGAIGGANIIELNETGKHKNRNLSLKHVRDLFNAGSEEFRLEDDSIIFKTTELVNEASSKTTEEEPNKRSRPSSVLFENPSHHKHMSTLSHESFSLEDYITSYQTYLKDAINESTSSRAAAEDSTLTSSMNKLNTDSKEGESKNVSNSPKSASSVDIVATAASTERLVDLLVLTASVFGTHIRLEDIKKYSRKTENEGPILLQMDDSAFTCTFFATYRVFYTTRQLIDSLHKRFDGSKSAALSIAKFMNNHSSMTDRGDLFPQWHDEITDDNETWSKINWKFVVQIQLGVIEATLILANDYFRHFMDDIPTKAAFDTFLEMMDVAIVSEWPKILKWLKVNSTPEIVSGVLDVYKSLQSAYKQVRNICIRKSYTPQCGLVELSFTDELTSIPEYMKLPPSTDIDEISIFINKLGDTIACVMNPIRSEDWIDTFEIIQMLITRSPLAMFNYNYQDPSTHPDLILVSNIYNWIMTLSDNENISKDPSDKLINNLPPSIRSVFKLYERIQNYLLMQIVDLECNLDERIERMSTLLKIIQICHARMKNVKLFDEVDNTSKIETSPYVPSFIESVVVNTIMLPESRFFSHSWRLAAEVWKADTDEEWSCDKLADMLPKLTQYESATIQPEALSICPGWILSRLVELACFVPNMDIDNTALINFNKNRFVYNCVLKIHGLQSKSKKTGSPYMSEFSFLFEFQGLIPSLKAMYQRSSHERSVEKLEKCAVFSSHVKEQIQLIKLEQNKRELLVRQLEKQNLTTVNKHISQQVEPLAAENDDASIATSTITNSQSFVANSSMLDNVSTYTEGDAASIVDTTSSTALNTVDPNQSIASNQSGHSTPSSATLTRASNSRGQKLTLQQQQQQQQQQQHSNSSSSKFKFGFFKSRPFSLNINNFNQPVTQKKNVELNELPSASILGSKQKPYLTIMLKDVSIFPTYRTPNSFTIDIGSSSSNHEYTFQTNDEQEAGDWIYQLLYAKKHWFYSRILNKQYAHSNVKLTFGAPLVFVCERDSSPIPLIVEKILCEIEFRGLEEVGIYRKSASLSVVQQIKDEVNKMGDFNMENSLVFDIHNLTGCIKAYLRELPEPLIGDDLVKEISKVREVAQNEARFEIYKTVLPKLPIYNYNLIERLSRHMRMIEEYKSQNRMTSYNLATIMGGSLVEGCRPETMREAFGLMNFICEDWILHYERVFQ